MVLSDDSLGDREHPAIEPRFLFHELSKTDSDDDPDDDESVKSATIISYRATALAALQGRKDEGNEHQAKGRDLLASLGDHKRYSENVLRRF